MIRPFVFLFCSVSATSVYWCVKTMFRLALFSYRKINKWPELNRIFSQIIQCSAVHSSDTNFVRDWNGNLFTIDRSYDKCFVFVTRSGRLKFRYETLITSFMCITCHVVHVFIFISIILSIEFRELAVIWDFNKLTHTHHVMCCLTT